MYVCQYVALLIYRAADVVNLHKTVLVVYSIGRIKIASFVDSSLRPNHKQDVCCPASLKTRGLIDNK